MNEEPFDSTTTSCCIVGGGPAGLVLSLLLARQGIHVTLLEAHKDFDRDFRGDTVHPSTLEILDQIGLAERLLQIPHGKMKTLRLVTREDSVVLGDLSRLRTKFPYVAMMPQALFLDFLATEARKYPNFRLVLGANVQRLVQENGVVRGVRYRGADDAWHEIRTPLTIAADGRFSKIRSLIGLEPIRSAPPMDVVWLRLPRRPEDGQDVGAIYTHQGHFAVMLERHDQWQVGYVILKGSLQEVRKQGIDAVRRGLVDLVPWLADRVQLLEDWKQTTVLAVESSRLEQWYVPGLLLIGDAAHVMSPVGGVGINVAIQDAAEAANVLTGPLRRGQVRTSDLAAVQRRREWSVGIVQKFQGIMQQRLAAPALDASKPFRIPWFMRLLLRLPFLRDLPGRMVAFGPQRVRLTGEVAKKIALWGTPSVAFRQTGY